MGVINELMFREKPPTIPPNYEITDLPGVFGESFTNKVLDIRSSIVPCLPTHDITNNHGSVNGTVCDPLTKFNSLDEVEVFKIIHSVGTKHCALIPMPTWLTKNVMI